MRRRFEISLQEWLEPHARTTNFWNDALWKLHSRFLTLARRDRNAVLLTLAAAAIGLVFALADPNIGPLKRTIRTGIDLLLIAGVVDYLRKEPREKTRKGSWGEWLWLRKLTRIGFVVGAVGSIAICLWVPNVDAWLKGYRISLAFVILGFGLTGSRRIGPGRNFAAAMALTVLFEMVELAVLAYTAATIETPIAYAGARAVSLSMIHDMKNAGMRADGMVGKALQETRLFTFDGRVVKTTPLADDLLLTAHDDPFGSMMASAIFEWNQPPGIIFKDTFSKGQEQHCRFMRGVDPPLSGYVTKDVRRFVRLTVENCARKTREQYWTSRVEQARLLNDVKR